MYWWTPCAWWWCPNVGWLNPNRETPVLLSIFIFCIVFSYVFPIILWYNGTTIISFLVCMGNACQKSRGASALSAGEGCHEEQLVAGWGGAWENSRMNGNLIWTSLCMRILLYINIYIYTVYIYNIFISTSMSGRCWTGMFFSSFPVHMPSLDLMTLMPTFHPCGVCLAVIRTNKVRECRPSPAKRYNTIILLSLKLWNIIHNFPFLECEWAASAPGCDQNTSGFPQFLSKELLGYCFPGTWDRTYLLDIPSRS